LDGSPLTFRSTGEDDKTVALRIDIVDDPQERSGRIRAGHLAAIRPFTPVKGLVEVARPAVAQGEARTSVLRTCRALRTFPAYGYAESSIIQLSISVVAALTARHACCSGSNDMSQPIFNQVCLDPTLVKGIYNTCDQWCMYCPATARCLVYRCSPDIRSGEQNIFKTLADRLYEGIAFYKRLCDAESTPTPELDAMLADDPRKRTTVPPVDDPLERMGARYARLSGAYLLSREDYPFERVCRASGPTPFEVFAWFHSLIAVKIYRALLCRAAVARGDEAQQADALTSAKVALIGIDRSLDALAAMAADDDDARLELLQGQLRRVRRELEARFPDARDVVREGLD
jgi:hypothetical protein